MELVGIENENGYFPEGFFAESLAGEIAEPTARWAEEKQEASPVERLAQVAPVYLSELDRARGVGDAAAAKEARTKAAHLLVEALGYTYHRQTLELDTDTLAPVLARVADPDGRDLVWILEAPKPPKGDEAADPLSLKLTREQFTDEERKHAETEKPIEEILREGIFTLKRPPKYVLVLGLNQIVLARRDKWPSRSVLRFDLVEVFDRRDRGTLAAVACFASREAIAPETGIPLVDRLEEEAQRRANAVTSSLKRTVRDAIEILGQEVLDVTGGKYPKGHERAGVWMDGTELSRECLRYMYRLLFLFYAEANPRLGVLDMKNPVYTSGYSLEALRARS